MSDDVTIDVIRAAMFAAAAHAGQRRKNDGTPYVLHPLGVAHLIASVGGVRDRDVLVAAILHDVVEDTSATLDDVERSFGANVRDIVAEVTDDKTTSKLERKRAQVANAPRKSHAAKVVKLADKLHNVTDHRLRPIASWSAERTRGYVSWCGAVAEGMRGTNADLESALERKLRECLGDAYVEPDPLGARDRFGPALAHYYALVEAGLA